MDTNCVWCGDDLSVMVSGTWVRSTLTDCSTCGAAHSRDDAGRLVLVGWPGGCGSMLESVRARLEIDDLNDELLTGANSGGDARLMAAIADEPVLVIEDLA